MQNLPAYMPRLTSAKPNGGDRVTVTAHIEPPGEPEQDVKSEAWIHVLEEGKSLEWAEAEPDARGRRPAPRVREPAGWGTVEASVE
ncbi:hypothetical protein ACIPY6_41755 [Streptomyces sp. NPDC090054]|uniref:hypothetical protein n=1 Tax=Streptomyces sp. NPDC090054 TaxID=3365933 RepID=UPI0038147A97